jgi:hypothetical protein
VSFPWSRVLSLSLSLSLSLNSCLCLSVSLSLFEFSRSISLMISVLPRSRTFSLSFFFLFELSLSSACQLSPVHKSLSYLKQHEIARNPLNWHDEKVLHPTLSTAILSVSPHVLKQSIHLLVLYSQTATHTRTCIQPFTRAGKYSHPRAHIHIDIHTFPQQREDQTYPDMQVQIHEQVHIHS